MEYTSASSVGVRLPTSRSGDVASAVAHPVFFSGFVEQPEVVAAALLVVAKVARTTFYVRTGGARASSRDPVVTYTPEGLRFESFSGCCGVYARLDVLAEALDAGHAETGVTNVDFDSETRSLLSGVGPGDPLHLVIGGDGFELATLDGEVREESVPLPDRWIAGFAETQVAAAGMSLRHQLDAGEASRFIGALPSRSSANAGTWAERGLRSLRLASMPTAGSVGVAGPERLAVLAPLLRFTTGLLAYGPEVHAGSTATPSMWQLNLPGARVTIGLSPERSRGFSGEGGLLEAIAKRVVDDSDALRMLLAFEPRIDLPGLARGAGIPEARAQRALLVLAASGQVGYDLHERAYFHRPLPFDERLLERINPRIAGARRILETGRLMQQPDGAVLVFSTGPGYRVVLDADDGDHCSCTWFGRHRGVRGPCRHVLAVRMAST